MYSWYTPNSTSGIWTVEWNKVQRVNPDGTKFPIYLQFIYNYDFPNQFQIYLKQVDTGVKTQIGVIINGSTILAKVEPLTRIENVIYTFDTSFEISIPEIVSEEIEEINNEWPSNPFSPKSDPIEEEIIPKVIESDPEWKVLNFTGVDCTVTRRKIK